MMSSNQEHSRILIALLSLALLPNVALPGTAKAASLIQRLGKRLYTDEDLSLNRNQSCESCHTLRRTRDTSGQKVLATPFVDPENLERETPYRTAPWAVRSDH